jgi:hypothetical protein
MEGSLVKENDELIQALQMRMSKLEVQTRRWRAVSVLMVLAGVLLVLVEASRSEPVDPIVIRARTVEARDFVLKDEHDRVRARLTTFPTDKQRYSASGQTVLQFFDENGEEVWVEPKQPTVEQIR